MSDVLSLEQRHRNMAAIHSACTGPELKLRHALWRLGFRYRLNVKAMPGKPDIVLPRYRTIVFIHGCFWHGHTGCRYYSVPKTNTEFWIAKIARNQERDQEVWRRLEAMGWAVIIVWECQLKNNVIEETVKHVKDEILQNGERYLQIKQYRKSSRLRYLQARRELKEKEAALLNELSIYNNNAQLVSSD